VANADHRPWANGITGIHAGTIAPSQVRTTTHCAGRAELLNHAMLRTTALISLFFLLGCGSRVPPIPAAARHQAPREAAPASAWRGDGRLEVNAPGHHLSADMQLRSDGSAIVIAIIADGGIVLLSGRVTPATTEVVSVVEALQKYAVPILTIASAWLPRHGELTWHGKHRIGPQGPHARRHYGGDPVFLRRVDGTPWPIRVEDYRPLDSGAWVAHALTGEGPLTTQIQLRLLNANTTP